MLSIFGDILCVLQNILLAIASVGVFAINGLVAALGVLLEAVVFLLPAMPAVPESGAPPQALAWLAWFYPVSGALLAFGTFLVCWGAFLVIRVVLRWTKAL